MDERSVRVQIFGRVQGVMFRAWTIEQAYALGLRGWVRNRRNGSVEAVIAGPGDQVDAMLARLRQGPDLARVDRMEIEAAESVVGSGFSQEPTA